VRKPTYPDEEQDLAAYHSIVAAYAAAGKKQAGALLDLATILFRDLENWVRSGRRTHAPTPRTLRDLAEEVKGRDGDLVNNENLRRAFRRFRERLTQVNASDAHPYGVAVPDYRLRARFCGPAMEISARFPDRVWLDFEVLPDTPSKRTAVVPVASFLPPLHTGFCGRQQLLEPILQRALGRKRSVVGFCGLPQVGKTAAAIALAESYVTTMGGIAAYVDVRASRGESVSGERIHRTLLSQLGVEDVGETTDSLLPRVFSELHAQTGVIVFDDVGDGAFLRDFPAPTGWLFIVTSRVMAPIDGLRWFPLHGLDLADARSLLLTLSRRTASWEAWRDGTPGGGDYHWRRRMETDRRVVIEETTLDVFAALAYACDGLPGLIRDVAATLANDPGLAVGDYLLRWTADAPWESNLLSLNVLARFAAAIDTVVATLDANHAATYRKISLLAGPIRDDVVKAIFRTGPESGLGTLAAHGLLVWEQDQKAYVFPDLVLAHAAASLRSNPNEFACTQKDLAEFLAHDIRVLRDPALPPELRRDLTAWVRAYADDVTRALHWTYAELAAGYDSEKAELFDVLSDAFLPSNVCPSTLIFNMEPSDRQVIVEVGMWLVDIDGFEAIAAKALYLRGVYSRNTDDLERAALLTKDAKLRRACHDALLEATAATPNASLRQIARLQMQIAADIKNTDNTVWLEHWIVVMRLHVVLGDLRTVDRIADWLRAQLKARTSIRSRSEYSQISVILAMAAALRRRWSDVRRHAARAAKFERIAGVATALQALGLAGLDNPSEARKLLVRVEYSERLSTPAAALLALIGAATHLLLNEADRACTLLTSVADAERIPYDRTFGMEAYRAIALLLRANCQRVLGRVAEAQVDGAKSLELLRRQQSRLRRAVAVLAY
jgi:hypothetical protein